MRKIMVNILAIAMVLSFSEIVFAGEQQSNDNRGSYRIYSQYLFQGKQHMKRGEFQKAQADFMRAVENQRLVEALAWAATASYKVNDLRLAERSIEEAEKQDTGSVNKLRIAGYKALIYLKEGRETEGIKALEDYSVLYSYLDPLMNIQEVRAMIKKGNVDLLKLETLLDEQITWHEDEIEQYEKTGTGFYGRYN